MVFISRWQPNIHHSQIIARAVRVIYDSNFGLQSQGKYHGCLQKQSGDRNQWAFAQAQHRLNTSKKTKRAGHLSRPTLFRVKCLYSCASFTNIFPLLVPSNKPINAAGAFSIPSNIVS